MAVTHRLVPDSDACACGGQWVYFDNHGNDRPEHSGYGCDVAGVPLHACCEGSGSSNRHADYCENYQAPRGRRHARH